MGAGTGAKTIVDPESSSWQAVLERIESEFRLEVAAQEDLREELLFLEKGRNYLDLRFAEGSSIAIEPTSSTDPLADQLLPSKDGVFDGVLVSLQNGDCLENSMGTGQHDSVRKRGDSSGVHVGCKGQSYVRRSRFRSNRYGNGHISPKAMEKLLAGEDPLTMHGSLQECALSPHVHMQDNALPFSNRCQIVSKKCQGQKGSDEGARQEQIEILEGPCRVKEHEASKNMSLEEAPFELGMNSRNVRVSACVPLLHHLSGPEGKDISSCDINAVHLASVVPSNLDVLPRTDVHALDANGSTLEMRMIGLKKLENFPASEHSTIDSECASTENHAAVERLSVDACTSDGSLVISQSITKSEKPHLEEVPNVDEGPKPLAFLNSLSKSAELLEAKQTGSDSAVLYNESFSRNYAEASKIDMQFKPGIIQVKREENLSSGNLSALLASGEASRLKDTNGIHKSVVQKAGPLQGRMQSAVVIQRSASRLPGRLSSTSSSTTYKSHGVLHPRQGEKIQKVSFEAEKVKANKFVAARKEAHEDIIIEDAEAIKVSHKHVIEWGRRKAAPEPSRRRSRWDFVLEEMAWMANDFMQERLWKTAAAAQICSLASQGNCPLLQGETTLEMQQRAVSSGLAKCVLRYWQSAESVIRESCQNPHGFDCAGLGGTSDAVPMDVDVSTIRVLGDNEPNGNFKVPSSLQDYALRFMRSSLHKDSISKPIGPLTPERVSEANVLDNTHEKKFPKESLLYVVPQGAFELYRLSVENEWLIIEAEHEQIRQEQAAAFAEAEAQAPIMGSGSGLPAFVDDFRSLICQSSTRTRLSGEADELEFQSLSHDLDTNAGTRALIAEKKRKQIPKSSFKFLEDMPTVGSSLATPDTFTCPSYLYVTGKRPFNNSFGPNHVSVGSIPTKRIRTAAVASRHRANGGAKSALSTVGMTGFGYKKSHIARTFNFQQKDFLGLPDESGLAMTADADLSPKNSVLGVSSDGTYNVIKSGKKKKTKQLHLGLPLSSTVDGAVNIYFDENATDSDSTWQQEAHQQHEQKEQIKRKSDQILQISSNNSSSDAGFVLETPETPGSEGPIGQQPLKKMRVSKQVSDGNLDGVVTLTAPQANTQIANPLNTNKILRQNSTRDRLRKNKAGKAPVLLASTQGGTGIPWSTVEDQAIVALVHDLGPNWELVSDVLSLNSQIKGIFRKAKDSKDRFKVLLERLSTDDGDSPDEFTSLQAHSSAFSGIPKSSARMLLQRLQGPVEEDSLKVHFEQILRIVQRDHARRHQVKHDSQEMLEILPGHASHAIVVSQFNSSSLIRGCLTPLELCDRPSNGDVPINAFTMQPANMNGLGFPALLTAGSGLRPSSAGLSLLPGLQMGPTLSPSTTRMNAAIDAQRMAAAMRPLSAEEQRLRYTQMAVGRAMPPGTSPPDNFSLNSPHFNDSALLVGGLSRPMALPRPGMQSMLPPGASGDVLPSGGAVMPSTAGSLMPGSVVGQLNFMRQSREAVQMIRSGQCTEEQRQMLMQELQHHAAQGNTQAVAALNSLNGNLASAIVSSPNQGHMVQQQPNMLAQQSQNPNQAYMTAVRMAKERQFQQQQQEQQKWIFQQQQLHQPNIIQPQQQHVVTQQLQMQQQSQQQQFQQQEVPTISPFALQQQPPQTFQLSEPQQHTIPQMQQSQTLGQVGQLPSQPKLTQQKSLQRYQQLQQQFLPTKGPKGMERTGAMVLPSFPSQSGQSNLLAGQEIANQQISQSLQMPQQMQGQRVLSASGSVQLPHQASQVHLANTGHGVQAQGQALEHIQAAMPNAAAVSHQPNELLLQPQHSSKEQQTQLQLPPSSFSNQPQQQSKPPATIAMLPQSPPPQSSQYQLRRQTSQPQPPPRRLQHRQASLNTGLQTGTLMGKNSSQQPTPISSQVLSNSGPFPLQMETSSTGPSSTGVTAQVVPISTAISSTIIGGPSTRKPGQGFSSMSSGVYNLTRSNNSSTNELSPTRTSQTGHHIVSTSAVNSQRSMAPSIVGSAPLSGPGSNSIQVPVVSITADPTVARSPNSSW